MKIAVGKIGNAIAATATMLAHFGEYRPAPLNDLSSSYRGRSPQ